MTKPLFAVASALALTITVAAQAPVRVEPGKRPGTSGRVLEVDDSSLPAMATGEGSISGRAIDAGTGLPIIGARVSVASAAHRAVHLLSNSVGIFVATGLPKGAYSVSVELDDYLPGAFGRHRPGGSPQSLTLNEGEHRQGGDILLWQYGAIDGLVTDDQRVPVADARMQALSRTVIAGTPRWAKDHSAATDAKGNYLLDQLIPGEWIVAATTPTHGATFFPASSTTAGAVPVELASGARRSGIDFVLTPLKTFSVSGVVSGADAPAPGVRVTLESMDPLSSALGPQSARSDASGAYTFLGVAPGDYRVRAIEPRVVEGRAASVMPRSDDLFQWAEAGVSVIDRAVVGEDLLLHPAPRVSGVVRFSGVLARPDAALVAAASVFLDPADGQPSVMANIGTLTADGHFTTSAVLPGRYLLRMAGTQAWNGWSIASAQLNRIDISDEPIDIVTDTDDVVITFTDRPSRLLGSVTAASGAPDARAVVVVFPTDRLRWIGAGQNPRRMRRLRTDASGRYNAVNLPDGGYFVAAVDESAGGEWNNPEWLDALARTAARVTITAGQTVVQGLRTVTIRQ